ncbi:Methyltransferase domain protein [Aphelenchoides bicaudatus]|nr:Methyltransferase domain protein [Aphelenchoides bicaudatus]
MNGDVEQHYVQQVYAKLAAHSPKSFYENASQRSWPNVTKFIQSLETGSVIVDVGCGVGKYVSKSCFTIGIDSCSEVLLKAKNNGNSREAIIGDAMNLPFRKDIADAILSVSVLHHFSTLKRRKRAIQQISKIMKSQSVLMCYVWALEQPYGEFGSQDVLVPWNMHEIPLNNNFPYIRFHKNSTREQRIIANSIPIEVNHSNRFLGCLAKFVSTKLLRIEKQLPPAIPQFINDKKSEGFKKMIVSGIHRWSPMLGRRLRIIQTNVEELYATELSETIVDEAMTEALATLRKVIFYRYYHVFKRGELEELISERPELNVLSCIYDSANWCVIAQKQ